MEAVTYLDAGVMADRKISGMQRNIAGRASIRRWCRDILIRCSFGHPPLKIYVECRVHKTGNNSGESLVQVKSKVLFYSICY